MLNVQARLEESVLQELGGDSLRRQLTEAYEVSAGLSESPSFRGTPKASIRPARTRRASYTGPARARHAPSSASRLHRPRTTDLPPVEVPPPVVEDDA